MPRFSLARLNPNKAPPAVSLIGPGATLVSELESQEVLLTAVG